MWLNTTRYGNLVSLNLFFNESGALLHSQCIFGHTGTYNSCVLEWNWWVLAIVGAVINFFYNFEYLNQLKLHLPSRSEVFLKPFSEKIWLNICMLVPIQQYGNTSGYNTDSDLVKAWNLTVSKPGVQCL